ncbi:MAG: alpha/beta fold hydrolase [Hyphomonadaceae bacterium]
MSALPAESQEFVERRIKSADGLSIYVRDYAALAPETGVPVFCLHGLTRNSKDFDVVAPRIAALGRRTLAWDTRGRGLSDRDSEPARYNPAIYVQDALATLDQLSIEKAVFVGTSMGGLITMVLSAMAPQRIAASVLNDIGPEIDPTGLARIAGYVGNRKPVTNWDEAAEAIKGINGVAFPDKLNDHAFWLRFAHNTFRQQPDGSFAADYDPAIADAFKTPEGQEPAPQPDLKPLFAALSAAGPVLVVRGGISDLLSPAGVATMKGLNPKLETVDVPRVGHAPTLEEPEAWNAIVSFLAKVA